jgi:GH24 family phage-related lysozyme (muramidase)
MIYYDKDPSLKSLLVQEALAAKGYYTGELDNWFGPRSQDALAAYQKGMRPAVEETPTTSLANLFRDISADGVELIKHFEGLYLTAYLCPGGVWTIGYGHTGLKHKDGTVYRGRKITQETAEELFRHDIDAFEGRVMRLISVPLNDDEFAALVSFDFNTGGLADSTLRRKLNAGDRAGAADELLRWNRAGGKVLAGLTRRRKSERNLFLGKRPYLVR